MNPNTSKLAEFMRLQWEADLALWRAKVAFLGAWLPSIDEAQEAFPLLPEPISENSVFPMPPAPVAP